MSLTQHVRALSALALDRPGDSDLHRSLATLHAAIIKSGVPALPLQYNPRSKQFDIVPVPTAFHAAVMYLDNWLETRDFTHVRNDA